VKGGRAGLVVHGSGVPAWVWSRTGSPRYWCGLGFTEGLAVCLDGLGLVSDWESKVLVWFGLH